jgi:hypothetical protein
MCNPLGLIQTARTVELKGLPRCIAKILSLSESESKAHDNPQIRTPERPGDRTQATGWPGSRADSFTSTLYLPYSQCGPWSVLPGCFRLAEPEVLPSSAQSGPRGSGT